MVLYTINDAIKSIESSHKLSFEIEFNVYKCKYKEIKCESIEKEVIEFSDNNIKVKILKTDNCEKAKICGINIIED